MWRKATLSIPDDMSALACSVLPVHPWVYGVGQAAGDVSYLSPVNATEYLAKKLESVSEESSIVVHMLNAPTHTEFMGMLTNYSSVLPLPVISQVKRRAEEAAALAITKMQIPAKLSGGLPAALPLSTATNRLAVNAQRIAAAKVEAAAGTSAAGLLSAMKDFASARGSALSAAADALTALKGKTSPAWVFTAKGNGAYLAGELRKNIPNQDSVFTLATLFCGADLSTLEAMIHDDNHART